MSPALVDEALLPATRRYQDQLEAVATRAMQGFDAAWDRLANYDEEQVEALAELLQDLVAAVQQSSANATVGYLATTTGNAPTGVAVSDIAGAVFDAREPFIATWKALANGEPFEEAVGVGRRRGHAVVHHLTHSTARRAAGVYAEKIGATVERWRRVPDGKACAWCRMVAGDHYTSADAADFGHRYCGCTVLPVLSGAPIGDTVAAEVLGVETPELGPALPSMPARPVGKPVSGAKKPKDYRVNGETIMTGFADKRLEARVKATVDQLQDEFGITVYEVVADTELRAVAQAGMAGGRRIKVNPDLLTDEHVAGMVSNDEFMLASRTANRAYVAHNVEEAIAHEYGHLLENELRGNLAKRDTNNLHQRWGEYVSTSAPNEQNPAFGEIVDGRRVGRERENEPLWLYPHGTVGDVAGRVSIYSTTGGTAEMFAEVFALWTQGVQNAYVSELAELLGRIP